MKQYKTIAGPIEIKIKPQPPGGPGNAGNEYKNAVKQYAAIIDNEAVGGWALHLIQQITVRKLVYIPVIIGAIIGAILGAILGSEFLYEISGAGGFFLGLLLGGGFGCLGLRYKDVLFNMLIFVKDE